MKLVIKNGKVGFTGKGEETVSMQFALVCLCKRLNKPATSITDLDTISNDTSVDVSINYDTQIFTTAYIRHQWSKMKADLNG